MLAASSLFAVGAAAKDEPPAADPKAVEVIREIGLVESPTALRDQKGWRAPKRIIMVSGTPYVDSQAAASGVEIVTVKNTEELIAQAGTADAIIGGDNVVCDERVLARRRSPGQTGPSGPVPFRSGTPGQSRTWRS
jgi:ABC-type amino acid transport substrate-binding protein